MTHRPVFLSLIVQLNGEARMGTSNQAKESHIIMKNIESQVRKCLGLKMKSEHLCGKIASTVDS